MKETSVWNNFNNLNVNVLNNNLVWPRDFESFQCAKFNTFLPVYCDVQVCYGTAVEHRSLLNRSSVCGGITCCNIFVCSCRRLCIKTAFNLVKRPLLFHAIVIQWSAIIYIFVGHVVIVFGGLKYIPRLFPEYMVTFVVEEPMKIWNLNCNRKIKITGDKMGLIKITENWSRKINIRSTRHVRDSRTWFIETEQHTLEKTSRIIF